MCVSHRQNEHLQDTLPNHPNRQFPSILTSSQAFHRAPPTHNKWQTGRCNTLPPCLLFCLIRPPLGTTSHRYILTSVLRYQTLLYKNTPENDQINSPKKTNHKNQCHKHCQQNLQLCEANCSSQKTTPKLKGFMTNAGNHLSIHFHER